MKTFWRRQMVKTSLVLSFSCVTLGADGPRTPAGVLHASGKVQVNGSASRRTMTLFSGDTIQTDSDSTANIIASGSSVRVMRNASVKFLGKAVELIQGEMANRHLRGDVRDGGWSDHHADHSEAVEIRSRGE